MDMAAMTLRDLPAELCDDLTGDPAGWAVLALPGPAPVRLVAGPDAAGGITILAVTDTWIELLWPLVPGATDAGPTIAGSALAGSGKNRVDLVALGDSRALALIPGQGLIRLDPLAGDAAQRAVRLKPGRGGAPDRIFALGDGVTGLWQRSDGRTLLVPLDAAGKRIAGGDRAGPRLHPGQKVGLILHDAAGRDVVTVDDHRTGFHLWRDDGPGGWQHLTGDGAARFAMNAGVVAAILWGDRIVLATGRTDAVRQAAPGLPAAAELIALDPDGLLRILAGEMRISARGLMVPELSAGAIVALGLGIGQVAHLGVDAAGRLIVAVSHGDGQGDGQSNGQSNGQGALLAIGPDGAITPLAAPCPAVLALEPDRTAAAGLVALVAG